MATLIRPMDFNPASFSKKTLSYTIPVDRYGFALPLSPMCTVDTVEVFLNSSSTSAITTNTNHFPVPPNFTGKVISNSANATKDLHMIFLTNPSAAVYGNANFRSVASTNVLTAWFNDGHCVNPAASTGGVMSTYGAFFNYVLTSSAAVVWTVTQGKLKDLWLPEGSVIAGDCWDLHEYYDFD